MVTQIAQREHVRSFERASEGVETSVGSSFSQRRLLISYGYRFWRYKWIIACALVLGLFHGAYDAYSQIPQYRATLTMLIDPEDTISEARIGTANFYTWKSTATQGALIQSRSVAEDVVDNLFLVNRFPLLHIPERRFQTRLLQWFHSAVTSVEKPKVANDIKTKRQKAPHSNATSEERRGALAQMIRSGLSVRGDNKTELIYLNFTSPDPVFASEIVNAVARTFIAQREEVQIERAQRTNRLLTEQLPELKLRLMESIGALQEYRLRESVSDTQHFVNLSNTRMRTLVSEVTEKRLQLAELSKSYGAKHPKIIAAKTQLLETEKFLTEESEKILGARQKEFKLSELEQEVKTNREFYEKFLSQLRESNISANQAIKDARIIDPAIIPKAPFAPNESKIIRDRVVTAIIVSIGLVLLIIVLDNTFKDTEQIEEMLAIPCLGALPLLTKSNLKCRASSETTTGPVKLNPEFYIGNEPKSVFAESVNHIRTGVIYSDPDNPPGVLVVSSAVQNEGKTTLASNLALAFSRFGETLLIDADLRNPALKRLTNIHQMPGLVDLIIAKATMDQCIIKHNKNRRLSILNHGVIPPNPLELLSSRRFKQILNELKEKYRYIVIDAPPILPVSDAIVLAHSAGALILTVEANKTRYWTTRLAIKRLSKANIRPLGLVLSKLDFRKSIYPSYDSYYAKYYTEKTA